MSCVCAFSGDSRKAESRRREDTSMLASEGVRVSGSGVTTLEVEADDEPDEGVGEYGPSA